MRRWAPDLPQWACFDTEFHSTLPEAAHTYALPERLRQQGLRRYGFHGINHQHVAEQVAKRWTRDNKDSSELRLISTHLGAGASLAAVKGGRCIDTTMGYTPLEGLVMATRSGSVDPGLILDLMHRGTSEDEIAHLLQHQSGLKGLSGLSGDMREIRDGCHGRPSRGCTGPEGVPSPSAAGTRCHGSELERCRCSGLHRWDR